MISAWVDLSRASAESGMAYLGGQVMELIQVALAHAACGLAVGNAPQQLPALLCVQAGRVGIPLVLHWAPPVPPWLLLHCNLKSLSPCLHFWTKHKCCSSCSASSSRPGPRVLHWAALCLVGCSCMASDMIRLRLRPMSHEGLLRKELSNDASLGAPCATSPSPA